MISGFQNHLHALYGLPGGWGDTSDVLDVYAKQRREEQLYEEQLAAQILASRMPKNKTELQKDATQLKSLLDKNIISANNYSNILNAKIRHVLLLLAMEDD